MIFALVEVRLLQHAPSLLNTLSFSARSSLSFSFIFLSVRISISNYLTYVGATVLDCDLHRDDISHRGCVLVHRWCSHCDGFIGVWLQLFWCWYRLPLGEAKLYRCYYDPFPMGDVARSPPKPLSRENGTDGVLRVLDLRPAELFYLHTPCARRETSFKGLYQKFIQGRDSSLAPRFKDPSYCGRQTRLKGKGAPNTS